MFAHLEENCEIEIGQFIWRDIMEYLIALSGRDSKILQSANGEIRMG